MSDQQLSIEHISVFHMYLNVKHPLNALIKLKNDLISFTFYFIEITFSFLPGSNFVLLSFLRLI